MKIFLLIVPFLLTSCITLSKREFVNLDATRPEIYEQSCFIKWTNLEHKEKYLKGLNLSREEKSEKNLLFPPWENPGFIIYKKINPNEFSVVFNLSDPYPIKVFNSIKDKYLIKESDELMASLRTSQFKFNRQELEELMSGYEQVICVEMMNSQVL